MTKRTKLIAAGACFAVLVIWYVALWAPRGRALTDAREREEAAQLAQDDLRVRISRLKAAQRDEPTKRARLETLRAAVPDQPNLGQFILDTNEAANRSGIEFLSISPTQPSGGTPEAPAAIGLNLSLSGGYFQVLDFINRLSTAPRLVVIDSLNVGGLDASGRLSIGMTARMFTTAGAAPAAGTTTTTTVPGATGGTTTTAPGGATTTTGAP